MSALVVDTRVCPTCRTNHDRPHCDEKPDDTQRGEDGKPALVLIPMAQVAVNRVRQHRKALLALGYSSQQATARVLSVHKQVHGALASYAVGAAHFCELIPLGFTEPSNV